MSFCIRSKIFIQFFFYWIRKNFLVTFFYKWQKNATNKKVSWPLTECLQHFFCTFQFFSPKKNSAAENSLQFCCDWKQIIIIMKCSGKKHADQKKMWNETNFLFLICSIFFFSKFSSSGVWKQSVFLYSCFGRTTFVQMLLATNAAQS